MLGLLMLTGLSLARHFGYVLRPERRSGGNRASREQDGTGMQALPGTIPCGDIKFRQFLIFFVNFHWHTPRIKLGASLSKPGRGQKIDSRECSVRYGNFRHQKSGFKTYGAKSLLQPAIRAIKVPWRGGWAFGMAARRANLT